MHIIWNSLEAHLHPFLQLSGFNKTQTKISRIGQKSWVRGPFCCSPVRLTHWCLAPFYAAPKAPRECLTI